MALVITVNISDRDQIVLRHDLLDIDDWVQSAVLGKINNVKKRLIIQGQTILRNDPAVTTMPANDDGIVDVVTARPDYRDRATRDTK